VTALTPSPEDTEVVRDFSDRVEAHLINIRRSAHYVEELNKRRAATVGTVRDAYTTIITETLREMIRLVDIYKCDVCDSITDYEAGSVLNTARFPNMARF
jgi:hypothetical protein